jgi:hypothetical protein
MRRWNFLIFATVILSALLGVCFADAEAENEFTFKPVKPIDALWDDVWTLPDTLVTEIPEIATDKDYLPWFALAGAASVVMHNEGTDEDIADNFEHGHNLNRDVDRIFDYVGGPGTHFAVTGIWYMIAHSNGDELNKDRSWKMMKALSITGASTLGLKLLRNNKTPNGKDLAWPSGHTSSSFTVAAVLDEFYGPEVGLAAYLGAGFVGYRMMDSGDHWASDVLFGAVLGYIVGHHVAGEGDSPEIGGFKVIPYTNSVYGESVMGVNLTKKF